MSKLARPPERVVIEGTLLHSPAYGENPWQGGAGIYTTDTSYPLGVSHLRQVGGNATGYNNFFDALDGAQLAATHVAASWKKNFGKVPAIFVGVKHRGATGGGVDDDPLMAATKMARGNPEALFGGVVETNCVIDGEIGKILRREGGVHPLDTVVAPSFTEDGMAALRRNNGQCRLLVNPNLAGEGIAELDPSPRFGYLPGGLGSQENYSYLLDLERDLTFHERGEVVPYGDLPLADRQAFGPDLVMAWGFGSVQPSNTIFLVANGEEIGSGVCQPSRKLAAQVAVMIAKEWHPAKLEFATAYSDAFFPFPDAVKVLASAGIKRILTVSGSTNGDPETIRVCRENGIKLFMMKNRGFKH